MTIREVPRPPRRGLRAGLDEPPATLRVDANQVQRAIAALAELRVALGVPHAAADPEERAVEVTDPAALTVVPSLLSPLRSSTRLVRESGVDPAALQESSDRVAAIGALHHQAQAAEVDVTQHIKVVAQVLRQERQQVLQQARVLLGGAELTAAEKQELALELARIERDQLLLNQRRAAAAARTKSAQAQAAAALAAEERRLAALRTVRKLRRGEPVDPEAIRAAFAELGERPGEEG